ncbi:hypothetical protein PRIPAC_94006 [Pristionchus pacificus]|uniref:Uncharacterized protein n=1 Tax=Pristionchus pacificus TaxID=54126 RepID=A0A2A6BP38_PRIPA|nr:hypothetical protein PRIPAC_94006 [Pristionchus pacificus]|eukprot:PDM67669.1 hypothetical protein PRIPAC_45713 [Pristionchus pacificus]
MNETGESPVDFYDFSGLRHLSQKGIEILEFYTTFNVIPVELQQFFKRTIDYYSKRKQRDGEVDLYAELPYYLRSWDDLEEDEPQPTSASQSANENDESRSEDNDFPGYDPAASACAGASTPLLDPFDNDSPASPMVHAPSSPFMMGSNGYDDPSPSHRGEDEQPQEQYITNEEDVDHQENPTGPVALIGDGTFYCPFVIVDDPSPPETAAPPAEVADSKEVIGQARSSSNQSPTITSSVLEAVDESHQRSHAVEPESIPSGSIDPVTPAPSSALFQGIQEFLHEEANLTLILPVAPPSPTDLQIDESESTAGDDGDEGTTKRDEGRDEIVPVATEPIPPAPSFIKEPTDDQSEEEDKEAPVDLKEKEDDPPTSNTNETTEAVGAEDIVDVVVEAQKEDAKEVLKDNEEPPKKKRRFSWNESSDAMEAAAVDSSAAGTSSTAPSALSTASPRVYENQVNSRPSSDPPTPPPIPHSSSSTSSVDKPKPNAAVETTKNPQDVASSSTKTTAPAAPPRVDEKQENANPSLPSPPSIPTSSAAKPYAAVETNQKSQTVQPVQQPHQRQPQRQIPVFTPTRHPSNFNGAQPPPSFQPMNDPFSQPPPNMTGDGHPFNNMQCPPLQQLGGPFHQQSMRPYQPPGPGPWNSQWVPLAAWSPPNGPPQFTSNLQWASLGPFGPLAAPPMMAGPPGNAFAPRQFEEFCAFCDSIQPHASEDCGRFGYYASREARARDMNLCPHCLGKHNPRCCVAAQRPCPNCGKHNSHVAFCLYR